MTLHESAQPKLSTDARETDSRRHHSRRRAPRGRGVKVEALTVGNGLYLQGPIGEGAVNFLVDTRSCVSIVAPQVWRQWGRWRDEQTEYVGCLCSVEGRSSERRDESGGSAWWSGTNQGRQDRVACPANRARMRPRRAR